MAKPRDRSVKALVVLSLAIVIRLAILAGRFLLSIVMVKLYSISDFGTFSIFLSTITAMETLSGLELQQVSRRTYLKLDHVQRPQLVRDQFIIHLLIGLLVLAALLALGPDWRYRIGLFPPLMFVVALYFGNFFASEFQRFIALECNSLQFMISLFFKTGCWAYLLGAIALAGWHPRSLDIVLITWLICLAISLVYSAYCLRRVQWRYVFHSPVNPALLFQMVREAWPFFIGFALTTCLVYVDRYCISVYEPRSELGVYTFYSNLTRSVDLTLASLVPVHFFPKLFKLYNEGSGQSFDKGFRTFAYSIGGLITVGTMAVAALTWLFVVYLSSSVPLKQNLHVFGVSLIGSTLLAAGHVPQMGLYLVRRDRAILLSLAGAFATTLLLLIVLVPKYGILGAAWATTLGNGQLLATRLILSRKVFEQALHFVPSFSTAQFAEAHVGGDAVAG